MFGKPLHRFVLCANGENLDLAALVSIKYIVERSNITDT